MARRRSNGFAGMERDILLEIFRELPPRALAICSTICSSWHQVITSDPTLWELSCRKQAENLSSRFPEVLGRANFEEGKAKVEALRLENLARFRLKDVSLRSWQAHSGRINCCSSLMETLVTGSRDSSVKVWSLNHKAGGGSEMEPLEVYRVPSKMDVIGIEFDGARIIAGAGQDIHVWSRRSSKLVKKIAAHNQRLYSMHYNDPEIIVGCGDGTVRYFDLYTGRSSLILRHHRERVTCLGMSSSLQLLATGSHDCTVHLCDPLSGGKVSSYFPASTSGITCLQMLHQGLKLVVGTVAGTLDCWDIRAGKQEPLWSARGSSSAVNCIDYQEYGSSVLLVGGNSGGAGVLSANTGKLITIFTRRSPVVSIATGFSRALTCHADGQVIQRDFKLPGEDEFFD